MTSPVFSVVDGKKYLTVIVKAAISVQCHSVSAVHVCMYTCTQHTHIQAGNDLSIQIQTLLCCSGN